MEKLIEKLKKMSESGNNFLNDVIDYHDYYESLSEEEIDLFTKKFAKDEELTKLLTDINTLWENLENEI